MNDDEFRDYCTTSINYDNFIDMLTEHVSKEVNKLICVA